MGIIYREEKGEPLTSADVDGNFRELEQRLRELEKLPATRGVHRVIQQKDTLVFEDAAGLELGKAKIPIIALNPRGTWKSKEDYAPNDVVTHENAAYLCLRHHKSEKFGQGDWQVLFKPEFEKLEGGKVTVPQNIKELK